MYYYIILHNDLFVRWRTNSYWSAFGWATGWLACPQPAEPQDVPALCSRWTKLRILPPPVWILPGHTKCVEMLLVWHENPDLHRWLADPHCVQAGSKSPHSTGHPKYHTAGFCHQPQQERPMAGPTSALSWATPASPSDECRLRSAALVPVGSVMTLLGMMSAVHQVVGLGLICTALATSKVAVSVLTWADHHSTVHSRSSGAFPQT